MKSKIKFALIAASVALGASACWADAPTFSGYLETTYNYNLNQPTTLNNHTNSFNSQANTFNLNAFQLQAQGKVGDSAGYTAKALFGTDANAIKDTVAGATGLGNSASTADVDLEEAYMWWKAPLGSGLTITAGKFVTYEGIEVIEGNQDVTVTRGLLFSLAEPYTHTGIKADYQFTKQLDLSLGVVNGWDQVTDNNSSKTFIGRLGINLGDPFSGGISWTYGDEKSAGAADINHDTRTSIDATFATVLNKQWTLNYQANYGEEAHTSAFAEGPAPAGANYGTWFGFGLQPKWTINDKWWMGMRYEYFEDKDGARLAAAGLVIPAPKDTALQTIAIAPAYNLTSNIVFQTELRYDWSNQSSFDQRNSGGAAVPNYTAANQAILSAKVDYTF